MYISRKQNNSPSQQILIFIPHAGGYGENYISWFKDFSNSIDCRYILLPGRGKRINEPMPSSINDMALQIALEINELENIPISIFGHSMGGIIAFELAKSIENQTNRELNKIFISGCRAPSTELKYKIGHLNEEDFLREIIDFGGVDSGYQKNPELLEFFLPILREDINLCESYQYQHSSPVNTPVVVLWGTADNLLYEEQVRAWTQHSFKKVTFFPFEGGNHFYFNTCRPKVVEIIESNLLDL